MELVDESMWFWCETCHGTTEWYSDTDCVPVGIDPQNAVDAPVRRCSDCERTVTADGVVLYA
jgi:hypothetical protein